MFFRKFDVEGLKSLAKNESICVCKHDKGRGVVLVDKSKYVDSMTTIKFDSCKLIALNESPHKFTLKTEDKINYFLHKLKSTRTISDELYNSSYVSGSSPGILYDLPKVHKPNFAQLLQF